MTYSITFEKGEISILQDLLDRHMNNVKKSEVFLKTELDEKVKNLTEIKRKLRFLDLPTKRRIKKESNEKDRPKTRGPYKKKTKGIPAQRKEKPAPVVFTDIPTSEDMLNLIETQFRSSKIYDQSLTMALYAAEHPQTISQIYEVLRSLKNFDGSSDHAVYQGIYHRLKTYMKYGIVLKKEGSGKWGAATYQPLRGIDPLKYAEKVEEKVAPREKEAPKGSAHIVMKSKDEMINYVKEYLEFSEEYDKSIFQIFFEHKDTLTGPEIFKIASSPFNFEIYSTDITPEGLEGRLNYFTTKGILRKGGNLLAPNYSLYTKGEEGVLIENVN